MAITIGRLGYIGFGLESTPGTAVSPDVFLPFTDVSLRGHHEPIEIIAAKTSRLMDKDSVVGKKWGEGDIAIDLDVVNSGYLWKLALGEELVETGTPNYHTFYVTTSGNTPQTATVVYGRDTDVEQYTYVACNELTMEVSDGLASLTASVMSKFPTAGSSQTPTTTSGTVFSFKDMSVRFGSDLASAASASATPINELSLTLANNLEVIHRSGSADVSVIRTKGFRASGSYTVYFDSETDKNAYYALNKRAMEIKFTGNANEELRIRIPRFRLSEGEIATGLDDFFVINAEFVAEDITDAGCRLIDVRLANDKSTAY
ncbi:MAG: phage tail tube protein [Candidatus Heimdallarchaeota archaeon]